jgi:hypothetical protein
MTAPVLIKKSDLANAAKVAREQGCAIEIRARAVVYTIRPDTTKPVDGKPEIPIVCVVLGQS